MKIDYKSVTGEIIVLDVPEKYGVAILDSRRKEENLERKERYHTAYSLDSAEFEGEDFADYEAPENQLEKLEEQKKFQKAFATLTKTQQRRIMMFADGMSTREIARRENVDHNSVIRSINLARKKFKNNF